MVCNKSGREKINGEKNANAVNMQAFVENIKFNLPEMVWF